jgi:hypothetical protein
MQHHLWGGGITKQGGMMKSRMQLFEWLQQQAWWQSQHTAASARWRHSNGSDGRSVGCHLEAALCGQLLLLLLLLLLQM